MLAQRSLRVAQASQSLASSLLELLKVQDVSGAVAEFGSGPSHVCAGQICAEALPRPTSSPPVSQAPPRSQTAASTSGASASTWRSKPGPFASCLHSPTRGLMTVTKSASQTPSDDELSALSELLQSDQRGVLTPSAIVDALNRYIVGQEEAKRAVAIAMRNRWRRSRLPRLAADEVMPKNILMVGPTGVGKTEIARRLAKLADAPFIKVEATKYTELGYVGRDVEDIIKDLVEASQALVRQRIQQRAAAATAEKVENIILNALLGPNAPQFDSFRDMYREGKLDGTTVELELPSGSDGPNSRSFNIQGGGFIIMEQVTGSKGLGGAGGKSRAEKQKMTVAEARAALEEAEADKLMSSEQVAQEAIRSAEQDGIVFIDEIDKIVEGTGMSRVTGGNVSSDGVQRDLLPIIEGSVVPTKHGNVDTSHILFICAGAFHSSKPQDMLAELQGRLPIRVSLRGLTSEDFYRILTEPELNMIRQQQALLATEDVELEFTDQAVRAIAKLAEEANRLLDNIGARRLHTILERILSDVSFAAPELSAEAKKNGQSKYTYLVDESHVYEVINPLLAKKDLSRYVL